jgi:cyclic 2,3-diphosphoglycerate synthase
MRALAIVDGDHYAPVVRDALAGLPYEVVAAVLVGGTEKLRGGEDYGVPLAAGLEEAVARHAPDCVVDLSDEPVLGPRARLELASRALALGLPYLGADFRFDPPRYEPFALPSIGVIGTGKRVGKTAVTTQLAKLLARELDVLVLAMGRGGPREPELVEAPPALHELLSLSRAGRHAASDHLEIAALAGVPTIGCRRCGGGLAGAVGSSNVGDGSVQAVERGADVVVFDGSGAAIPPVAVDRRVLVVGRAQDPSTYLNPYRVLVSDLAVVVGGDPDVARRVRAIKEIPVVRAELRLRATEPLRGRRTAVFATGAVRTDDLEADVVHVSASLADRARLREELVRVDADVYLVELKAAAIDVVAEVALERGAELVLAGYDVVALTGEPDLDAELLALAPAGARA